MNYLSLSVLTIASLLSANTSFAQSGRPINSVETAPGTSVPFSPTDSTRPPEGPEAGAIRLPGSSSDLDKDAGSSKADRNASRKKLSFPNDRKTNLAPVTIDPQQ